MKNFPAWLSYTVLRLLMIAVPFAILLIVTRNWIVSAIAAVFVGFALSYIFLKGARERMAQEMVAARTRKPEAKGDDADEDAEIEASDQRDAQQGDRRDPEGSDRHDSDAGV